jgi:Phage tail sheath protein subtilisin-like domain/Phage tail sheath C-terminal domain
MAEMILPGTYIEVRAEGLIAPGRVSVGNLGVVGTASDGPTDVPVILGSYSEARERFGDYDAWIDGSSDELTLVRALELAYGEGATTVFAVRVASGTAARAAYMISSAGADNVLLEAKNPGTAGNELSINITDADQDAFIEGAEFTGGGPFQLGNTPVNKSARNRIRLLTAADGLTRSLQIIYDDTPGLPGPGQVKINRPSGVLEFGDPLDPADRVTASFVVASASAVKVTLRRGTTEEVYTVVSGDDLVADINKDPGGSAFVTATPQPASNQLPDKSPSATDFASFGTGANTRGDNGASGADYKAGLELLLTEPAHIIVAAGQDDSFGDELNAHCQTASTDVVKGDRIGVTGSSLGATLDSLRGHNLNSDRLIFVAPGIKATDAGSVPPVEVTLPGAYTAAAVAGLLAALPAHNSPTNKVLSVGGLEQRYTSAELTQLVQSRVLAVEQRQGFRIVKGITTSTNTAFAQITTRRIVDFAKFGVRLASTPYIGLLNNERVRTALRSTINSFLGEMVDDEMLISYELEVSATRAEEIKGIVRVTMVLRPTFSIDFIKVTMFLE